MRSRIILVLTALSLLGYGCGETTGNNDSDGGAGDGGSTNDGGTMNDGGSSTDGGNQPAPLSAYQALLEANEAFHETVCMCDYYYGSHYCEAMSQEFLPLLASEEECVNGVYSSNASTVDPWIECSAAAWSEATECYEDEECRGEKGLPPEPDGGSCDSRLADALDECPAVPEAVVTGFAGCTAADEASVVQTAFLTMRTLCITCTEDAASCKEQIADDSRECMDEFLMYILDDYEPEDPQAMLNCLQDTYKRAMLCWAQGCDEDCLGLFYDAGEECGVDPEDMEALLFECAEPFED